MEKVKINLSDASSIGSQIGDLVDKYNVSYIDACLMYCEINSIDEDLLGEIIRANQPVISEITKEAEQLNFLQKQNRLQFSS